MSETEPPEELSPAPARFATRRRRRRWLAALIVIIGLGIVFGVARPGVPKRGTAGQASFIASGGEAGGFSLAALEAGSVRLDLASARGRPLLINFWASWCVPCREEMPLLEAAYRHESRRVAFMGIDTNDTRSSALAFARATGVTYPLAFDPSGAVADEYGLFGLPTTIFVMPNGRVVGKEIGQLHAASLAFGLARLEAASHR